MKSSKKNPYETEMYYVGQPVVIIAVVNSEPRLAVGPTEIKKINKRGIYLEKGRPFSHDGSYTSVDEGNYYYLLPYRIL